MTEKEKAQQRFKKIIISKNLKELISHFDFEKELKIQYEEGLELAPDTDLFIEDRIKSLEGNVQSRKSSVSYGHNKFYELGDYIRIGYSWVVKGIRGSTDDFETMTYRNLTLNSEVPPDRRHGIYYILLAELARGASIAFHISFLRKELKKMLRTIEPNMRINHLLPTFQIHENDRLWLKTILESSWNNKKLTYREIKAKLKDFLPKSYDPKNISRDLLSDNGEQITVLGIIEAEGDDSIIKKCDRILMAIQNIIIESPTDEPVYATKISEIANVPYNEVTFLLYVIYADLGIFSGAGTKSGSDYLGYDYVSFDDARYRLVLQIENTVQALTDRRRKSTLQNFEESAFQQEEKDVKKPSAAVQVLAIHYLLKKCGINSIDNSAAATRLVQFLTGRELNARRVQDTTVFKHVRAPFKSNDQSLLKDLQTIRPYFDDLGLQEIVAGIDREIKESRDALTNKKSLKRKSG